MPRKPPRSTEERLVRAQKSMMPGTLGGRVASAAPMSLDVTRLDPRLRASPASAVTGGGGFDPNADPVVIGNGASATTGSLRGVVVGFDAVGDAWGVICIGWIAHASDGGGSANGPIAIGVNAYATADDTTAVGGSSQAASVNASAFGVGADAHGVNSTAIGAFSTCTDDYQIMLGTTADFVEIPGNGIVLHASDSSRWRLTVDTSGSPVWSAA